MCMWLEEIEYEIVRIILFHSLLCCVHRAHSGPTLSDTLSAGTFSMFFSFLDLFSLRNSPTFMSCPGRAGALWGVKREAWICSSWMLEPIFLATTVGGCWVLHSCSQVIDQCPTPYGWSPKTAFSMFWHSRLNFHKWICPGPFTSCSWCWPRWYTRASLSIIQEKGCMEFWAYRITAAVLCLDPSGLMRRLKGIIGNIIKQF